MVVARTLDDGGPGVQQWFQSLPVITQYWFGGCLVMTLSGNFGIISPMNLLWSWRQIKDKLELWRLVTCFCYAGPFSFPTVITVYMLYTMSSRYESGSPFNTGAGGGTADYCFALMFAAATALLTYPLVLSLVRIPPLFTRTMVYFVMYVWSKRNPTAQASIWGIPLQAIWLPFAYLALTVFMGNPYFDMLHGLAIGHLYYFLVDVFPQVYGRDLLVTPRFLIDKFGVGHYRPQAAPRDPQLNRGRPEPTTGGSGAGGGGHQWGGGGRRLGRD